MCEVWQKDCYIQYGSRCQAVIQALGGQLPYLQILSYLLQVRQAKSGRSAARLTTDCSRKRDQQDFGRLHVLAWRWEWKEDVLKMQRVLKESVQTFRLYDTAGKSVTKEVQNSLAMSSVSLPPSFRSCVDV